MGVEIISTPFFIFNTYCNNFIKIIKFEYRKRYKFMSGLVDSGIRKNFDTGAERKL